MELKIDYNIIINHPEDKVIEALKDFKTYGTWWPKKFRIKYIFKKNKDLLIFSPVPTLSITWEIKLDDNKIKTNYTKGPVKGSGVFKTSKINDLKTKVHYDINVSPRINIIKTIPSPLIKVFKAVHVFHMKQLFKSLERHLN